MKIKLKLSTIAISLLLLSGCNGTAPEVQLAKTGSEILEVQTDYTRVLEGLNGMIQVFHGEPMSVYIDTIENKTAARGKLPADMTDIVKTSFNKIGDYVTIIYDDNSENLKRSDVYKINGAITEFDVVYAEDRGVNGAGQATYHGQRGDTDFSADKEAQKIQIALNFNPSDLHGGNYISRTSTSNKVTVEKKSSANAFALSILGTGFGLNNAITKSQGIHASLVVLAEFSTVEVLGKLGKFPYWLLSSGGKVNRDVVNHLSRTFLREPLNKKIEMISYLFALKGTNGIQPTRIMTPELEKAIIQYKSQHGMSANKTISKKLYLSLLEGK